MVFAAPIWLLLLIPWTGALVWALVGRVEFARVPAVFLWDRSNVELSRQRQIRKPPAWVMWMLAAALAGILSASGFGLWSPRGGRRALVVVDCGLTMSAKGRVADAVSPARFVGVRALCVPGDVIENESGLPIERLRFTAAPTRDLLSLAVRKTLAENAGTIYVVTDQAIDVVDARLVLLRPTKALENVGIESFAVSERPPQPQAMVRVYNGSAQTSARLIVDRVEQAIELPPRGARRDYFVDLSAVGSAASAQVIVPDDLPADNAAWVVQQRAWPRIEARTGVSAAMQRMIEVYARQRPAASTSRTVAVVEGFFNLPDKTPAVAIAPAGGGQALDATTPVRLEFDHPLSRGVDWPKLVTGSRGHSGPGEGWQTIVSQAERVLVATRDAGDGVRQVWVGIDAPDFALRPDFVVFFANIFDWLGESTGAYGSTHAGSLAREFRALAVSDPTLDASPGLYKRSTDGELAATTTVAAERLIASPDAAPQAVPAGGYVALARAMIVAAIGCAANGVRRLTRI